MKHPNDMVPAEWFALLPGLGFDHTDMPSPIVSLRGMSAVFDHCGRAMLARTGSDDYRGSDNFAKALDMLKEAQWTTIDRVRTMGSLFAAATLDVDEDHGIDLGGKVAIDGAGFGLAKLLGLLFAFDQCPTIEASILRCDDSAKGFAHSKNNPKPMAGPQAIALRSGPDRIAMLGCLGNASILADRRLFSLADFEAKP